MKTIFCLFLALTPLLLFAQPTQTVRGKVYDNESNFPLIGAKVEVLTGDSIKRYRGMSDEEGHFVIEKVPVGKFQMEVKYPTYDIRSVTIEVTSGKECVVNVPMNERIVEQKEVTVSARKKGEVINEMALISAHREWIQPVWLPILQVYKVQMIQGMTLLYAETHH
jgi:hypothetical protein